MLRVIITSLLILFIFSGCSTKKYFEPEDVKGSIEYDGELKAKISDATRDGATLQNGEVIRDDSMIVDLNLTQNERFLTYSDGFYLITSSCGEFKIVSSKNEVVYKERFKNQIASANIKDFTVALVLANNELIFFSLKNPKDRFDLRLDEGLGVNYKIASPEFLEDLVIFPTLDGRLVMVDKNSKQVIKNIIVSSDKIFNNIIFMDIINDRLVAATGNRAVSISPRGIDYLDESIKDIIFMGNRIFVFTKNGRVLLCNDRLKVIKERKYPYANFTGVIQGKFIYAIEKEGYLIAVDKDLKTSNVYKLPDSIDEMMFTTKSSIYYNDSYYKLAK
jgi:hypothetical protein